MSVSPRRIFKKAGTEVTNGLKDREFFVKHHKIDKIKPLNLKAAERSDSFGKIEHLRAPGKTHRASFRIQ